MPDTDLAAPRPQGMTPVPERSGKFALVVGVAGAGRREALRQAAADVVLPDLGGLHLGSN
jgi:hypothetical protein